MLSKNTQVKKKGGTDLMNEASKLIIPFGLYLAKQSLEKFVHEDSKSKQGKKVALKGPTPKPPQKLVTPKKTIKGGTCGSVKSIHGVEGYTTKQYASVGGKPSGPKQTGPKPSGPKQTGQSGPKQVVKK